jgi:hypothetical protein
LQIIATLLRICFLRFEINDGFVHHEAARANFEIVSWEFVNPPQREEV